MDLLNWIESTAPARTVGESLMLTAWLSATHAIGYTFVMSGALVWNLNVAGILLSGQPAKAIVRPARWVLLIGLTISLITGLIQFAPRASYTAINSTFQLKITLLIAALAYQLTLGYRIPLDSEMRTIRMRVTGTLGVLLWVSLALAACWFILFE